MIKSQTEYGLLALIAGGYIVAIFSYRATPQLLVLATIIFGALYFCWGVWHHLRYRSFHARIVLEYFLVALLGIVLVSTLLA